MNENLRQVDTYTRTNEPDKGGREHQLCQRSVTRDFKKEQK
jgi:hypothetical protein